MSIKNPIDNKFSFKWQQLKKRLFSGYVIIVCSLIMLLSVSSSINAKNNINSQPKSQNALHQVYKSGKYGFIDNTGKIIIDFQFDKAEDFSEGLAAVKSGGKWGYINNTGKFVIAPKFSKVFEFSEGLAQICENYGCGYINKSGHIVIKPKYTLNANIGFSEGFANASVKTGEEGFIDKTGKMVIQPIYSIVFNYSEGLAPVVLNRVATYIDKNGRTVISNSEFTFPKRFSEGSAAVCYAEGGCGFIDKTGKRIIYNPKFSFNSSFSEGLAVVKVKTDDGSEKYGFINHKGVFVIKPTYDDAQDFSEGLAAVKINDDYGYINTDGKVIVDFKYRVADKFKNGLAKVWDTPCCPSYKKYIDSTGKVVWTDTP